MPISTDELEPTIYLYYRIRQGGNDQTDIIVTMEEASVNDQLDKLANQSLKALGPQFETRVMQHAVNQAVEQIVKYLDNADTTLDAIDSGFIVRRSQPDCRNGVYNYLIVAQTVDKIVNVVNVKMARIVMRDLNITETVIVNPSCAYDHSIHLEIESGKCISEMRCAWLTTVRYERRRFIGFIVASIVGGTAVIWSNIPIVAILLIAGFYVLFYSKPYFQIRSEANELSRQARLEVEKLQRRHPEWGIAD